MMLFVILTFTIQASDEIVFHIECPPDVTVACDAEVWDLSIYGNATVFGYGSPTSAGPPESEVYNLNSCGSGTIVRTWVAYDYSGTAFYCSQTIYVGTGGYGSVGIIWPDDYYIHSCSPQTHPNQLPPPYDFPQVDDYGNTCVQIMMNYEDLEFNLNPPACKKILRKWTVIDWCQYDPNAYNPSGIWQHTQIIKVLPENPPIIYCPSDTTVTAGGDCTGGHVSLNIAMGSSDCGAGVTITNHSPYAYSNGADASGFYPLGTTKVIFTADDGCGGNSTCSMYVTVQDMKKPTPVCYYGISIALMQMPDGYYMDLRPDFFNKGSFDNCTPAQYLTYSVEPSRVTCADIGTIPVQMFVTDGSGNSAYCNTIVHVQDNMEICPDNDGIVQGIVHTMSGAMMPDVSVTLQGMSASEMTNGSGEYSFEEVPFGNAYTVMPETSASDMTGITTIDLVVLLKHILGIESLHDPLFYLAADLDGSSYVSVADLLILKEMIIRNHHEVPTATSWRFIDDNYVFNDPNDPLSSAVPDGYVIGSLSGDMIDLNFTGIKMGDLSGDAVVEDGAISVESRSAGVQLIAENIAFNAGEAVEVPLTMQNLQGTTAVQFALKADIGLIRDLQVSAGDMPGTDSKSFGLEKLHSGHLSFMWFDIAPTSITSSEVMVLRFIAKQSGTLADVLRIDDQAMLSVSYDAAYNENGVSLGFGQPGSLPVDPALADTQERLIVGKNYPNPFTGVTTIPITLMEDQPVEIAVYNLEGKLLFHRELGGVAGAQEIRLKSHSDLNHAEGVLICRISTRDETKTVRMLALNAEN